MKPFLMAIAATLSLTAPVGAQSLSVLLPVLTFPDETVVPSSKGCAIEVLAPVCAIKE